MSDYFDASDWGSDQELEAGIQPLPGKYHVIVTAVDSTFSKSNSCLLVTLEIQNGTVPGQNGKQHIERVPVRPNEKGSRAGVARGARFLRSVGLLKSSDLGNNAVPVNFQDAIGRDLVVELEKGEKYTNVTFLGFWETAHQDVQDVPKGGYRFGGGAPGGAPSGAAQQQQAAYQQPQQQQVQPAQQQAPQTQAAGANGAPDWSKI